jgi:hypothetical protein
MAMADELAGLLRGASKTTLGLPGDLNDIARDIVPVLPYRFRQILEGLQNAPAPFPTSDELDKKWSPAVPKDAPAARKMAAKAGESVGEWTPFNPVTLTKMAGRTAGRGLKAADTIFSSAPRSGSRAAQRGVVKAPGGNWLNEHVLDRELEGLKTSKMRGHRSAEANLAEMIKTWPESEILKLPESQQRLVRLSFDNLRQDVALNKWVDSNLGNYVKKQMGTEGDPVRALAEQGITHKNLPNYGGTPSELLKRRRSEAGFPEHGMATSPEARAWEHASDIAIRSKPAWKINDPAEVEKNQWLQKVPDRTPINYLGVGATEDLGFDKIVQSLQEDMIAGNIRPEQLNKISMPDAVQRVFTKKEAERKAKEAAELLAIKANLSLNPYKEYPSGHKWVELPDPFSSPENLKVVQDIGCQGGWCTQEVDNAELYGSHAAGSKLYALLDPSGKPHIQTHVKTTAPKDQSFTGLIPPDTLAQLQKQAQDIAAEKYKDVPSPFPFSMKANTQQEYFNLVKQYRKDHPEYDYPSYIGQIKPFSNYWGSQMVLDATNKNPNYRQELEPFIQDFVKSRNWDGVSDLSNSGLRRATSIFDQQQQNILKSLGHDVPRYLSPTEADDLRLKLESGTEKLLNSIGNPTPPTPTRPNTLEEDLANGEWEPEYKRGGKVNLEDQYRFNKLNGTILGTKYRM